MQQAARRGVDWWIHRIAASDRYNASPHEIRNAWPFAEALQAHLALDAIADARAIMQPTPTRRPGR